MLNATLFDALAAVPTTPTSPVHVIIDGAGKHWWDVLGSSPVVGFASGAVVAMITHRLAARREAAKLAADRMERREQQYRDAIDECGRGIAACNEAIVQILTFCLLIDQALEGVESNDEAHERLEPLNAVNTQLLQLFGTARSGYEAGSPVIRTNPALAHAVSDMFRAVLVIPEAIDVALVDPSLSAGYEGVRQACKSSIAAYEAFLAVAARERIASWDRVYAVPSERPEQPANDGNTP